MPGVIPLSYIQLGRESTAGTAVAATHIWRGMGWLKDTRIVEPIEEHVGLLVPTDRQHISWLEAAFAFDSTPMTFEQLPHLCEAGIEAVNSAQDGAGSDYIRDYELPFSSQPTIKTYTMEGGDNQQNEEAEYCFVTEFTLEGKQKEAWKMSANWLGRQVAKSTKTGSLTLAEVESALFSKTKLYIDDGGGTIGSTQVTATLLEAKLNVKTGLQYIPVGDGNLYFNSVKNVGPEVTLELTLEHNASAVAEKDAWKAETVRLIRLLIEGSTVASAGTTYSKKTIIIDLAGKWQSFETGDSDKDVVQKGTFRAGYNATDALFMNLVCVNEVASL